MPKLKLYRILQTSKIMCRDSKPYSGITKKFGNVFAMTTIRLTLMQELQNLFGKVFAMPTIRLALMQELQNLFGKVFALPTIRLTLMQELQNLFAEVFAMPTICQFRPRNTVYWFFLH